MGEPTTLAMLAGFSLTGLALATAAALKGWQGWLDLKRLELAGHEQRSHRSPAMDRIELADLKERIRKLEKIADGVDL